MEMLSTIIATLAVSTALVTGNVSDKKNNVKDKETVKIENVVSGTIYDNDNNETLAGATITVDGKKYYSDLDGKFSLPTPTNSCEMEVELISYEPSKVIVNEQTDKKEIKVHLIQK